MPGSTGGSRSTRPLWLLVGLLIAVGVIVPLLIPIYDQAEPTLFGFPFYYWFQFLLVPIVAGLTYLAFRLSQSATDRDRAERGLGPAAGREDQAGDRR